MAWLRLYDTLVDDPKVQFLPVELFKFWINMLCLANRNEPRGTLPSADTIAWAVRVDSTTVCDRLGALHEAGLVDWSGGDDGLYSIHGWDKRQFKSDDVNERVKRYRERQAEYDVTPNETLHETLQPPLHETHQKQTQTHTQNQTQIQAKEIDDSKKSGVHARAREEAPTPIRAVPKPKAKASTPTTLPEGFTLTVEMRAWAFEKVPNIDIEYATEEWLDYCRSKQPRYSDWLAAWRSGMRKAATWARERSTTGGRGNGTYNGKRVSKGERNVNFWQQLGREREELRNKGAAGDSVPGPSPTDTGRY